MSVEGYVVELFGHPALLLWILGWMIFIALSIKIGFPFSHTDDDDPGGS